MAVQLSRKSGGPTYVAKKGEEYMNAKQRTHFRKILVTNQIAIVGTHEVQDRSLELAAEVVQ